MKKAAYLTLAALAMLTASTGCIGRNHSFALFNNILDWNRKCSDNEWVNEIVFLLFCFVPVYGISLFADAVVFNSIDFWTGENPIASVQGTDAQGEAYAIVSNGDGTATLSYKGQVCTLTRQGDTIAISQNGVALGTLSRQGSLTTFTGADGVVHTALN